MPLTSAGWTPLDVYVGKLVLVAVIAWLLVGAALGIWHLFKHRD